MHILCTICSDLVNQAESLYVTKCGHIFHHHCLAQWIERSKSCPQCRNKVTEKCMFRMYPTVSHEGAEDAATLQSRLDDAMLQLRTRRAAAKELEERLAAATADLTKKDELLKASEKRLVSRESAAATLREKLGYLQEQNKDTQRLREENERMQKNIQMLNGLQKVLNATADEVEAMLRDYSDPRTQATFAAALKRALCDSESKRRGWRARQLEAERALAAQRARADELQAALSQVQTKLVDMERQYEALKHKRKASAGDADDDARARKLPRAASPAPAPRAGSARAAPARCTGSVRAAPAPADSFREQSRLDDAIVAEDNLSFGSMVARIESSASPYLPLRRGGLALAALRRAPRLAQSASLPATGIFPARGPAPPAPPAPRDASYDGLGGHTRHDASPAPRAFLPRPGLKHRLKKHPSAGTGLKKLPSAGSQDIAKMFGRLQDK